MLLVNEFDVDGADADEILGYEGDGGNFDDPDDEARFLRRGGRDGLKEQKENDVLEG
jgi:hypothetical protein